MSEEILNDEVQETEKVKTYDFPEGTVFYQEIREEDGYKWLAGVVTNPETADKFGFLDNNINMSELVQKNGRLYLKDYVAPVEETTEPVDLTALKEQKHQELRSERDKLRQIEFAVYNNATYQIRQEDQDNMNTFLANAIGMLSGIMPRENFSIMDAGNILRTLSPEQIIELGLEMKAKVKEIYARYWYARDVLLANATTKAEIDAIQIPATLDA